MDKSCANHPESMALATCKACEKSVCLMCVVDEKEGTFCSADCHSAFAEGRPVPKFVGAASTTAESGGGMQKLESIFDDEPSAHAATEAVSAPPPSDDPMPIVAEGTKWRPIGAQCDAHPDTPAVANCDRCGKSVCALCLLEAPQGTFCSAECLGTTARQPATQPAPAERAALQGKPVFKFKEPPKSKKGVMVAGIVVLLGALGTGLYYGWNVFGVDISFKVDPKPGPDMAQTPTKPDTSPAATIPDPPTDPVKPEGVTPPPPVDPGPETSKNPVPADPTPSYYVRPRPIPKRVIIPTKTVDVWADQEPGTWYRVKTVHGNQVTFTDTGLKEKNKDYAVLLTQTYSNGHASPVSETKVPAPTVYLRGEESFTFEGQSYLCEIRTPGLEEAAPKSWTLLSGKNMGAILKSSTPAGTFSARVVWEGTWRVDNQTLDCLVVEGQLEAGSATRPVKSWYCSGVPMGLVRQEMGEDSLALIHMGSDWSKRPAFGQ